MMLTKIIISKTGTIVRKPWSDTFPYYDQLSGSDCSDLIEIDISNN
jgi:hypothetical protein